jgi:hypothetical protein
VSISIIKAAEAVMRGIVICLFVSAILSACYLTSCTTGGSSYSRTNCSSEGEICVKIKPVEPIRFEDPVVVSIQVTSSNEISDLHLALHTLPVVKVDGTETWESNLNSTVHTPGLATWNFSIKAGETISFNRTLYFPSEKAARTSWATQNDLAGNP